MDVKWLISSYMLDRQPACGFPKLDEACKQLGFEHSVDVVPAEWWTDADLDPICVVMHGSKQFIRDIQKRYGRNIIPGAYAQSDKFSYSGFSPYYSKYMLNDNYILLPYAEVVRRRPKAFGGSIFIRPDKTSKSFTGMSVSEDKFDFEINALDQLAHPNADELCVVAETKDIQSEFRFVIVNGKVVTGSEYRWDKTLDIRSDILPAAQDLAETVAKDSWTPDTVWVLDVAMHNDRAYLLEINPFSSSGLYACDTTKIIQAVSEAAWNEFTGNDL